jgi:hypothetical protein
LQIHQMVATAMDPAAEIWNEEIDHPTFIAEVDQEAMELRSECARAVVPLTVVAYAIFSAADEEPDRFAHAEAVAAWALRHRPSMDGFDLGTRSDQQLYAGSAGRGLGRPGSYRISVVSRPGARRTNQ